MAKWDNMLAILWQLKSKKQVTAIQLADSLEISVRTVYRYIDALCASGVPIIAEPGHHGGYYLPEAFSGTPLFFENTELKALTHATLFAESAGYPFGHKLKRALEKIELQLNDEQRKYLQRHKQGFAVIGSSKGHPEEEVLQNLEQAAADCRAIKLEYIKTGGEDPEVRKLDPYGLAYRFGKWYIVGFCHFRQDLRTFRVDRIQGFSTTDEQFKRPTDFSIEDYIRTQLHDYYSPQSPVDVRIMANQKCLSELVENWYINLYLKQQSESEIVISINEKEMLTYLPGLLLPYGDRIQALEPSALRQKMVEKVQELSAHYLPR